MDIIVGIDLGTTNSEIAWVSDGKPSIIKVDGLEIVPSCAGLSDEGDIVVGHEALNIASAYPDRAILSVKRIMGQDQTLHLGDHEYSPQEISAFILRHLKKEAEKFIGQPINKAVITVPAYFTDAQRKATREAGEIAGINVARIINEPTAAALAYESQNNETKTVLVYDLGGGTFDVSVVRIEEGIVEVLSSVGDNHLGGDDFDMEIVNFLAERLESEYGLNVDGDSYAAARLKIEAEKLKKRLSDHPFADIEIDHIGQVDGKDIHMSSEISRMEFQEMIADDINRTMESVSRAMEDASVLAADIDKIIMVGGSTRIPMISRLIIEKFGEPPCIGIDPDLCVAIGAGIQAGREMGINTGGALIDVTPYTFGTSAIGQINGMFSERQFVPLIHRNTKLPASKTDVFYTVVKNQEKAMLNVFQGEEKDSKDNLLIGEYIFELSKSKEGSEILLRYDLDINGILKIEAIEKKTGKTIKGVIENAFSELSETMISRSRKRVAQGFGEDTDSKEKEASGAKEMPGPIAEILKDALEKLDQAPDDDKDEIINLMEDIKTATQDGDIQRAGDLSEELDDILFYID